MKKITLLLSFTFTFAFSQEKIEKADSDIYFEKSYKAQKKMKALPEHTEYFDLENNIYSNYKYKVAFKMPKHWSYDAGVSEHTIFRSVQRDSAIVFVINVIEMKVTENETETDIWELYKTQKEKMDYPYKVLVPKKLNSELEDFTTTKTYIKNMSTIKREFKYLTRELESEYYNTSIIYQTAIGKIFYTFSLSIPTIYYEKNPNFYDTLIKNISFL